MEYLQDQTTQRVLIVIVAAIIIYFMFLKKREGFEQPASALEIKQEDIPIRPPMVRPDTRTLMSGSGFIPQKEIIPAWGEKWGTEDTLDDGGLDDGEGGNYGLHYNLCSKACCSDQYPTPHKLPYDRFVCGNKDQYVPNSYMCNNAWQDSGCLCLTKKGAHFLASRGGNA